MDADSPHAGDAPLLNSGAWPVMRPIGHVISPFGEKFGVPRQPGIVTAARGRIIFEAPYDTPDAVRALDGFSHIWVIFYAHHIPCSPEFRPTVRPPRLGGNVRVGVFASRSLFRPNPIGLSLVRLEAVLVENHKASLEISGMDLVDGTPVLDIKPYLPYVEAPQDARGGFAGEAPGVVSVNWQATAEMALRNRIPDERQRDDFRVLAQQTLQSDPRPSYQSDQIGKTYSMLLDGHTLDFCTTPSGLAITNLR